jgi:hypothetical protein
VDLKDEPRHHRQTWMVLQAKQETGTKNRVARWHIFKPEIPIWVNFWRDLQWNMFVRMLIWSILLLFGVFWSLGIFSGHLVYFVAIWYILWPLGIFYSYLVYFSSLGYVVPSKIWRT